MNAKDVLQARISELEQELLQATADMKAAPAPENRDEQFKALSIFKDRVLCLRSAIAELRNVKEML